MPESREFMQEEKCLIEYSKRRRCSRCSLGHQREKLRLQHYGAHPGWQCRIEAGCVYAQGRGIASRIDQQRRQIVVIAKIEATDQKFNQTAVIISKTDGVDRIQSIESWGTKNRVVFQ
jgi:hypothetical protein